MSSPRRPDDGGDELLRAPRAVPVWLTAIALAAVVLGLLVVKGHQGRSSDAHPGPTPTAVVSRLNSTPALVASDVLLPGRSGFSEDTPGRIVLGTSIRNTAPTPLTIRYPIIVLGPTHRTLPPLQVGVFPPGTDQSSRLLSAQDRLVRIGAGRTAELAMTIVVDCEHRSALMHWPPTPFRAVVHATPAVGTATFDLTNNDIAIPFQVRSACRPTVGRK